MFKGRASTTVYQQWIKNNIVNYINIKIPDEAEVILGLGPKFVIKEDKVPIKTLIKDLEYCIEVQLMNENEKNLITNKVTNIISNYINKTQINKRKDSLHKHLGTHHEGVCTKPQGQHYYQYSR